MRFLVLTAALALACGPSAEAPHGGKSLILATTTSVRDSGLLDALLPDFSAETGIEVRVIAVGTGAALRMGREGNADALLTHAPGPEKALVADGFALSRRPFMENHFVLAGPAEDPADVRSAASAVEGLRRIRASGAQFISRGDDSGTHKREVALWREAGLDGPGQWSGFVSTGSGMGLTLQVAGERRAYVLSDVGTFLAFRQRIHLAALTGPEAALRNEYAILLINPEPFDAKPKLELARALEAFLVRPDIQARIGEFGRDRFAQALFRPTAGGG